MQEWLNKYFADALTPGEKEELFRELGKDETLKEEFARMQNTVALSGLLTGEQDRAEAKKQMDALVRRIRRRQVRRVSLEALKYAAVAVLVSGIWLVALRYGTVDKEAPVTHTFIEVPKGNRVCVTLPDQTKAWLSSRTKLKISDRYNQEDRLVELDGEGYFMVAKQPDKPFVVSTKQYKVQATGTAFNVFAYAQSPFFETDLEEGTVWVYNKDNKEEQFSLVPNEAVYLKDGVLWKSRSTFASSHLEDGIYYFENDSLGELINRLELWYDVKIKVNDPRILAYVFSGKFKQSDSIDLILDAIKGTGKFNYRQVTKNTIEIYP